MLKSKLPAKLIAELVGTAVLVLTILSINRYQIPLFTAIVAGVTVGAMYVTLGAVSGGHFNPAVSAGMLMLRRIKILPAILYVIVQFLGAVIAWQLFEWFVGKDLTSQVSEAFDWKIFAAEAIGAFVFAAAIMAATKRRDSVEGGLVMGSGLFIGATMASVASAGLLNPAVALGVRSFNLEYVFGPILGMVIGMGVYEMYLSRRTTDMGDSMAMVAAPAAVKTTASAKPATKKKTTAKRKTSKNK